MKKNLFRVLFWIAVTAFAFSSQSCSDSDKNSDKDFSISVAPETHNIGADGGYLTMDITSDGSWRIRIADDEDAEIDWITTPTASYAGNATTEIKVKPNTTTATRTGYVVVSLLDGTKNAKLAITQAAGEGDPNKVPAIKPIADLMIADHTAEASKLDSEPLPLLTATLNEATKTLTFTKTGNTIEKIGGGTVSYKTFGGGSNTVIHAQIYSTGWADWENSAWLVTLNATEKLSGNLRFCWGMRSPDATNQSIPVNWKVQWSPDKTTWNDIGNVGNQSYKDDSFGDFVTISTGVIYKMSFFNIPESKAIGAGQKIYFKISPKDGTPYKGAALDDSHPFSFYYGVYLTTHEPRAYNTSTLPAGEKVIYTYGFDDAFWGHDYFIPGKQFCSSIGRPYVNDNGWDIGNNVSEGPGYIMIGTSSATAAGDVTTPPLTALGDTPTDITVTFKAAFYLPPTYTPDKKTLSVDLAVGSAGNITDGAVNTGDIPNSGTAEELDAAYFKWREYSVKVSGATKDTRIVFKTEGGRHFLSEVVVTKD